MFIAIRKEQDGSIYIDKNIYSDDRFKDVDLSSAPYNFTPIEIDNIYSDCIGSDFNEDLSFSIEKYNNRKKRENAQDRVFELKQLLSSQDYKTIKYMQGELSEEEFSEVKTQCKMWRDEINELEAYL